MMMQLSLFFYSNRACPDSCNELIVSQVEKKKVMLFANQREHFSYSGADGEEGAEEKERQGDVLKLLTDLGDDLQFLVLQLKRSKAAMLGD